MCGRYVFQSDWAACRRLLRLEHEADRGRNLQPRYNIAPTQTVPFAADVDGARRLLEGRWWLVPHWAKELPKYTLFNARSEDAEKKPAFRDAFKNRRCLIPADAYYEWTKAADGGKDPHLIYLPEREPFAFAGLWAHNDTLDLTSCTILTAAADDAVKALHRRMPIILQQSVYDAWTDPATEVGAAKTLLQKHRGAELISHRVGREVNASRAQGARLTEALAET